MRKRWLLPLDDCLYALQPTIPKLTRSSLHRCLQRHRISRLPDMKGPFHDIAMHCRAMDKPKRQKFKRYPIGYFHIDIAELRTNEGKLYLFVAIDPLRGRRCTASTRAEPANFPWRGWWTKQTARQPGSFWKRCWPLFPTRSTQSCHPLIDCHAINCRAVDNGIQFSEQPRNRNTPYSRPMRFDMICAANGIEHRPTRPNHPLSAIADNRLPGSAWTNGQVEQMNRTINCAAT
jgi:hypothetical protein